MIGEALELAIDLLLDTGIVIRHLRNDKRAHDLLDYLEGRGDLKVSVITLMEVLVGCRTPEEEETSLLVFDRLPTLEVTRTVAEKASSLIKGYPSVFGRTIQRGTPDAIIAATAWEEQRALITLNTRQFAKAPISEITVQAIDQNAADWVAVLTI